jgi:membrane protein involved in colicin uptake
MAEASGSRSRFGGGDPNEEMVAKLIADTLQAENFGGIPP